MTELQVNADVTERDRNDLSTLGSARLTPDQHLKRLLYATVSCSLLCFHVTSPRDLNG